MGVDTKGKLTSNPKFVEVLEFLKAQPNFTNVNMNNHREASTFTYTNSQGEKVEGISEALCYFEFFFTTSKGEKEHRSLFLMENAFDKTENSSLPPFITKPYLYMSLGKWGDSVEVMDIIAGEFGGAIIPNDCADEDADDFFHIINGKKSFVFPPKLDALFNSLTGMSISDKYKLVTLIEDNKKVIKDFVN